MPIKMCHHPDMRTMAKTLYERLSNKRVIINKLLLATDNKGRAVWHVAAKGNYRLL
jgi:hypothetical protein